MCSEMPSSEPLALGQRVDYKYSTCSAVGPGLQRLLRVFHFAAKAILFSYFTPDVSESSSANRYAESYLFSYSIF